MNNPQIECPKCKIPLTWQNFNAGETTKCPACDTLLSVDIFPAFFNTPSAPVMADLSALDNESVCFFHPQKKAAFACAICGRFICSLCDIEFRERHVCPSCFEAGREKKKMVNLETHRVLYDDIALAIAIIPALFIWVTIITAPISIYLSLRHWKSPTSIIPRTKIRFIIAIMLSVVQIAAWFFVFAYIYTGNLF
jgi:hypothetical protein